MRGIKAYRELQAETLREESGFDESEYGEDVPLECIFRPTVEACFEAGGRALLVDLLCGVAERACEYEQAKLNSRREAIHFLREREAGQTGNKELRTAHKSMIDGSAEPVACLIEAALILASDGLTLPDFYNAEPDEEMRDYYKEPRAVAVDALHLWFMNNDSPYITYDDLAMLKVYELFTAYLEQYEASEDDALSEPFQLQGAA